MKSIAGQEHGLRQPIGPSSNIFGRQAKIEGETGIPGVSLSGTDPLDTVDELDALLRVQLTEHLGQQAGMHLGPTVVHALQGQHGTGGLKITAAMLDRAAVGSDEPQAPDRGLAWRVQALRQRLFHFIGLLVQSTDDGCGRLRRAGERTVRKLDGGAAQSRRPRCRVTISEVGWRKRCRFRAPTLLRLVFDSGVAQLAHRVAR